jgi:P2 family phage major capsid protein
MRNETRLAVTEYLNRLAQLNGVPNATQQFAVAPSVQQTLESKIQESSAFLQQINMIGVREMQGERLGLGVGSPVASRTDTSVTERTTRDITTMDARGYQCVKTDYDTHITYAKLDIWAKFPDFQTRVRNAITQRQALDRMLTGFHGKSAAVTTDLANNPLLQDVNVGWLQKIRVEADERVVDSGKQAGQVSYGDHADADYANLDSLVMDSLMLLDPWFREDPGLRAFVSRDLMHDKLFPLVNKPTDPTEILAADILVSQRRVGGLQAVQVPFFPEGTVLVTRFDNLSIYWQESARRRMVMDNPKRDRIENYESSNDCYVVEEYGMAALIENIVAKNK